MGAFHEYMRGQLKKDQYWKRCLCVEPKCTASDIHRFSCLEQKPYISSVLSIGNKIAFQEYQALRIRLRKAGSFSPKIPYI